MKQPIIITHRGLDPDHPRPYHMESSREAFEDQLKRGYGLEFDMHFSRDGEMIVIHDTTLARMTAGKDTRRISEVDSRELLSMDFGGDHLTTVPRLLSLISSIGKSSSLSAFHVKHMHQTPQALDKILEALETTNLGTFMAFDLRPEAARHLLERESDLTLAASVAHPYDIERYNEAVGGTLMSVEELMSHKDLYMWAWLDEWDLSDKHGGQKTLYDAETFAKVRNGGFSIAVVSPELHATSPGLLGGESHPDARDPESLLSAVDEIVALGPDAICTDHPNLVAMCGGRP